MKRLSLLVAVVAALVVTATAGAVSGGRFVGTPTCTADSAGSVECSARVAGLTSPDLANLAFVTEWDCAADQSIKVFAGNVIHFGATVQNGHVFTVSNQAHYPTFYELLYGVDYGCPGEAWTAVEYTDVTITFVYASLSYNVGTVYPS
jgi:hypothetical protein